MTTETTNPTEAPVLTAEQYLPLLRKTLNAIYRIERSAFYLSVELEPPRQPDPEREAEIRTDLERLAHEQAALIASLTDPQRFIKLHFPADVAGE